MERKPGKMEARSMNEKEALAFLARKGIRPLDVANWRRGQTVLYLLEDELRDSKQAIYRDLPPAERPTIARLDCPDSIEPSVAKPKYYDIENGLNHQIDYFAIDVITHEVRHLRSSAKPRTYIAKKGYLFVPDDTIFPKFDFKG
jgi:hypothetical protein